MSDKTLKCQTGQTLSDATAGLQSSIAGQGMLGNFTKVDIGKPTKSQIKNIPVPQPPSFGQQLLTNIGNAAMNKVTDQITGGVTNALNSGVDALTGGLMNSNGVVTKAAGTLLNSTAKNIINTTVNSAVKNVGKTMVSNIAKTGLKNIGKGLGKSAVSGLSSGLKSSLSSSVGPAAIANLGLSLFGGNVKKAGWEDAVSTGLSFIPVVGQWASLAFNAIGTFGGKKTIDATGKDTQSRAAQSQVASGYSGAMDFIANSEAEAGQKYSFWNSSGRHKANARIARGNAMKDTMWNWGLRNELNDIRSNGMQDINNMRYTNMLNGGYDLKNSIFSVKHGGTLYDQYNDIRAFTKKVKAAKHGTKLEIKEEPIIDKESERYYDDPLFSTKSKYNDDFHKGGSWSEDNKSFTPSTYSLFNFTEDQIKDALSKEYPDATLVISDEVKAFKEGGKLEHNVIPDGALHARLNHMDSDDYTKKGIPVVAKNGDKLEQTAEIERNEIIFSLSVTQKLEELMKDGSPKAALEAGKLLADEILHNTVDNTGLLKEVE